MGDGRIGGCGLRRVRERNLVRLVSLASGVPYLAYRTVPPGWMVPGRDVWRDVRARRGGCVALCMCVCGQTVDGIRRGGNKRGRGDSDQDRTAGLDQLGALDRHAGASSAHWS